MIKSVVIIGILALLTACGPDAPEWMTENTVYHNGALHNIMLGDINAKIRLDTLEAGQGFYALGAGEDLKSEILILDGDPYISQVIEDSVLIRSTREAGAAMLVYAAVGSWEKYSLGDNILIPQIEKEIERILKEKGTNGRGPVPFLIEGTVETLSWHVVNWPAGDTLHSHQRHAESGISGKLGKYPVTILGFYSADHSGIFTQMGRRSHMHFISKDKIYSGHLDGLRLSEGTLLKLPAR